MEVLIKSLLFIHVVAGFTSLSLFWLPVIFKKGSEKHKQIGRVYIYFMWIVVFSATLLSFKNIFIGKFTTALFLGFLALITANPLWFGIAILRKGAANSRRLEHKQLIMHGVIVLMSLGLISYGLFYLQGQNPAILMFVFGGLGLSGLRPLIKGLKGVFDKRPVVQEHAVGMITTGIAAHTAFLVFGAGDFFNGFLGGYWSIIPWIAPTVIGSIAMAKVAKKFKRA